VRRWCPCPPASSGGGLAGLLALGVACTQALRRVGVGGVVRCVARPTPQALTPGLTQPRVLLTTGLPACLDPPALKAVLWHESAHRRRRDPAHCLLAQGLARALFSLPLASAWARRSTLARKWEADREVPPWLGPLEARVRWLLEPAAEPSLPPPPQAQEALRGTVALGLLLRAGAVLGALGRDLFATRAV